MKIVCFFVVCILTHMSMRVIYFACFFACYMFLLCQAANKGSGTGTIVHCAREGNAAAHGLAWASYRGNFSREWRDKPPDFLLPFLVTAMIIV